MNHPGSMNRAPSFLLYINVLVVATCGLVYELLAGTLASYVLGDSVTQFSLVIGVYLSALGIGAWLSRFIVDQLARVFLEVELGVALIGGLSAPLLFWGFGHVGAFQLLLFGTVLVIGVLVGLELPLLMRILQEHVDFKDLVSRVLAFDYLGALLASVLFPVLFIPRLGLVRTSLTFGVLNALVGLWGTWLLAPILQAPLRGLRIRGAVTIAILLVAWWQADRLTRLAEESLFAHPIVYARTSPYQRIVVTRNSLGFQLYLNGNLQFNAVDEYRYHEALVHPLFASAALAGQTPKRVLVLGGGDGLAVREILRYETVKAVTLVDIDPAMTGLSRAFPPLAALNRRALDDPRVRVVNADAYVWLERPDESPFDAVFIDFPDPNNFALGKLYTTGFFRRLRGALAANAIVAIQGTSPFVARRSYWCIVRTMEAAGFQVAPYHAAVPSFGVWGYALACAERRPEPGPIAASVVGQLRYLGNDTLRELFLLPPDIGPLPVEINRLDNQALVRYYEAESRPWN
ncbi:MAG: Spermidine synthase [Planctomycetota bacterium]|jgi:spermidine synthase